MKHWHKNLAKVFVYWLPLTVVTTLLCGLIYATAQQNIRISANNPQIQIAEDYAVLLTNGMQPQLLVPERKIDISKNLGIYVIIFSNNGEPVFSSAVIDNKIPMPPKSIFDYVRNSGETRVTWQPRIGVRSAAVIARYNGTNPGFVLVGKSLTETEILEDKILLLVIAGWGVTLFASFFTVLFSLKLASKI